MKTATSNTKAALLLLGASLDVLHQESREWLETIAFWQDETKFFANLLNKDKKKTSEYTEMLKNLDQIHANIHQ